MRFVASRVPTTEIDHFDPIDRDAFVELCGVDASLVDALLTRGLLRPLKEDQFDARDAWLVRTFSALLDEGIELSALDYNQALIPFLRDMARVSDHLVARHARALRERELRFRDILDPLNMIVLYLFDRVHSEDNPNWREMLYPPATKD